MLCISLATQSNHLFGFPDLLFPESANFITLLVFLTSCFLRVPNPLPFFLQILVLFASHDQTISNSLPYILWFKLFHADCTLLLTSTSTLPSFCITLPKYLNPLTSGSWLLSIFTLPSDVPFRHKIFSLDLKIFSIGIDNTYRQEIDVRYILQK